MTVRFQTLDNGQIVVIERTYRLDGSIDEQEITPDELLGRRLHWTWEDAGDRMFEFRAA